MLVEYGDSFLRVVFLIIRKVKVYVRIDRNIGGFANELPGKSGALDKITRDIIYYIAKNARTIDSTLCKEFKWNTADYLRTVKTSRSILMCPWSEGLSDEEQQFIFNTREKEGYEWVKTKLDLAFYILSQINLSYSEKISFKKYLVESFKVFK